MVETIVVTIIYMAIFYFFFLGRMFDSGRSK